MAGGIEEGNRAVVDQDLVRADVLGDAARLTGSDIGIPDRVEQGGLAVVDMAHDHHDRRALDHLVVVVLLDLEQPVLDRDNDLLLDLRADLDRDHRSGVEIEGLVDCRHYAQPHQTFDDLRRGDMQPRRELPDCDLLRNGDREVFPALTLKLEAAHLRVLLLLAGHHRFACPPLCAALGQLLLLGRGVAVAQLALGEVVVLLVVLLHLNLGRACPGINRHAALRTLARLLLLRRLLVLLLPALPVILPLLVPTVLLPALLALSTLLLALPLLVPAVLLACLPVVLPLLGSWLGSLLRLRRLLFLRLLRLRF